MPHVARIASSVYDGICPGGKRPKKKKKNLSTSFPNLISPLLFCLCLFLDPICRAFSFDPRGQSSPHPSVQKSLLFNLVMHNRHKDAKLDERYFKEVFSSKYGLLRVYKIEDVDLSTKQWLADPKNRLCDRPGSWYCPGQYPPSIQKPPPTHKAIDYDKVVFVGLFFVFASIMFLCFPLMRFFFFFFFFFFFVARSRWTSALEKKTSKFTFFLFGSASAISASLFDPSAAADVCFDVREAPRSFPIRGINPSIVCL